MGLIYLQNRPKGGINEQKEPFMKDHKPVDNLEDVVRKIKPTAIIGMNINLVN